MLKKIFILLCCSLIIYKIINASDELTIIDKSSVKKNHIVELEGLYIPDEIAFYDEKNEKHYLEDMEGKVVLVVFWANWCTSCIDQLYALNLLKKDFKKLPFDVIVLSEDNDGINNIQTMLSNNNYRYLKPYYDYKQKLFDAFAAHNLPSAILISDSGQQVLFFQGITNWFENDIREQILSFIPEPYEKPRNSYENNSLTIQINNKISQEKPEKLDNNNLKNKSEEVKNEQRIHNERNK